MNDRDKALSDIGEFGLIGRVLAAMADVNANAIDNANANDNAHRSTGVLVGPGDDCAVLAVPRGPIVMTVDMLVEGRDFRRDWSSAADVGAKAMAASLADIAAMGAAPWVAVVAMGAPGDLPEDWAVGLAAGLAAQARSAGAVVVGGDMSSADSVIVSVTALGDLDGRAAVLRSGARPGDWVAVAGRLGWSAAGLALLQAGAPDDGEGLSDGPSAEPITGVIAAHRRPNPAYALGPIAAQAGASAMIDVSDGLVADARHIAQASGVRIRLESQRLQPDLELVQAARVLTGRADAAVEEQRATAQAWVLTGGEDHALLATFATSEVPKGFRVIGRVEQAQEDLAGVWLDAVLQDANGGFRHFAGD